MTVERIDGPGGPVAVGASGRAAEPPAATEPANGPGDASRFGELFGRRALDRCATVDRMRRLLESLGDPQTRFSAVHVTGTNGKTTTARMIDALLRAHGVRTGAFVSPHLQDVRERVRVDGEPIGEAALFDGLSDVDLAVSAAGPGRVVPSFFETMTALAFSHFAREKVAVAVVEVGRGGLRDATNVLDAPVAVLGPVALDHPDLGSTTAEIAADKAGIIAPGATVVVGEQEPAAAEVIDAVLRERGARPLRLGTELHVRDWQPTTTGQWFRAVLPGGLVIPVDLPLLGRHHADNALLALAAAHAWLGELDHASSPAPGGSTASSDAQASPGSAATPAVGGPGAAKLAPTPAHGVRRAGFAARAGLDANTAWARLSRLTAPGRCEIVPRTGKAAVWLDGAHNPAAAQALARTLADIPGTARVVLAAGVNADKDTDGVLSALAPVVHRAVLAPAPGGRGGDPGPHRETLVAHGIHPYLATGPLDALAMADQLARPQDVVLVTGSLYTVGAVREQLGLAPA